MARGELLLGEDRPAEASPILGRSWRLWQENDLPYESALARLHYAEAIAAEGDRATARRDLRAARAVFERLGATLDVQRVDALLGEERRRPRPKRRESPGRSCSPTSSPRRTWSDCRRRGLGELLAWHNRELRSAFASHRGDEVKTPVTASS